MPLRVCILYLRPLILLLVEPLQRMIVGLQIHIQVTVHRHGKNNIPNSVQLLLCKGKGDVCFFREQRPRRRNKLPHAAIDLIEHLLVHVRDVYTALPNGVVRITEVNTSLIEKSGELVIGIGMWNIDALCLLCHDVSLCPMKF